MHPNWQNHIHKWKYIWGLGFRIRIAITWTLVDSSVNNGAPPERVHCLNLRPSGDVTFYANGGSMLSVDKIVSPFRKDTMTATMTMTARRMSDGEKTVFYFRARPRAVQPQVRRERAIIYDASIPTPIRPPRKTWFVSATWRPPPRNAVRLPSVHYSSWYTILLQAAAYLPFNLDPGIKLSARPVIVTSKEATFAFRDCKQMF